jgi:hypothetical protein
MTTAGPGSAWRLLRARHFSVGKTYVHRGRRVGLVLNPKVGSTSIREVFRALRADMPEAERVLNGRFRWLKNARSLPVAPLRDYWHALSHPAEYRFYGFVRNPYARLKSAWEDKLAYGHETGYPRSIRGRRLRAIRRLCREHGLAGAGEGEPIPFDAFVALLETGDPAMANHHWDPQVDVLLTRQLPYHRLYHIETEFEQGMAEIFAAIGLPPSATRFISGAPRNVSTKRAGALYDAQLAGRVLQLYRGDFEAFGYDPDSWRGQ